jgi:hypothetical protein
VAGGKVRRFSMLSLLLAGLGRMGSLVKGFTVYERAWEGRGGDEAARK